MLTTWFAPRHSVAVNRMHAFVKYLDHSKYTITVVTLQTDESTPASETMFGARLYRVKNHVFFKKLKERAGEPKLMHNVKVLWNVLLSYATKLEFADWVKRAVNLLETVSYTHLTLPTILRV